MKFIKGVMSFSTKPMYTREFLYNFKLLNIDKSDIITGKKKVWQDCDKSIFRSDSGLLTWEN